VMQRAPIAIRAMPTEPASERDASTANTAL